MSYWIGSTILVFVIGYIRVLHSIRSLHNASTVRSIAVYIFGTVVPKLEKRGYIPSLRTSCLSLDPKNYIFLNGEGGLSIYIEAYKRGAYFEVSGGPSFGHETSGVIIDGQYVKIPYRFSIQGPWYDLTECRIDWIEREFRDWIERGFRRDNSSETPGNYEKFLVPDFGSYCCPIEGPITEEIYAWTEGPLKIRELSQRPAHLKYPLGT